MSKLLVLDISLGTGFTTRKKDCEAVYLCWREDSNVLGHLKQVHYNLAQGQPWTLHTQTIRAVTNHRDLEFVRLLDTTLKCMRRFTAFYNF